MSIRASRLFGQKGIVFKPNCCQKIFLQSSVIFFNCVYFAIINEQVPVLPLKAHPEPTKHLALFWRGRGVRIQTASATRIDLDIDAAYLEATEQCRIRAPPPGQSGVAHQQGAQPIPTDTNKEPQLSFDPNRFNRVLSLNDSSQHQQPTSV